MAICRERFAYLLVAAAPRVVPVVCASGGWCIVGGERAQARGAERVEVAQAFCAVEVGGLVGREEEGVFCVRGEVGPPAAAAWGIGSGGCCCVVVCGRGGVGVAPRDAGDCI